MRAGDVLKVSSRLNSLLHCVEPQGVLLSRTKARVECMHCNLYCRFFLCVAVIYIMLAIWWACLYPACCKVSQSNCY